VRRGIASTTTPVNVSALIGAQLGAEAWNWFEALAWGDVTSAGRHASMLNGVRPARVTPLCVASDHP
jgi:hypothetical protein